MATDRGSSAEAPTVTVTESHAHGSGLKPSNKREKEEQGRTTVRTSFHTAGRGSSALPGTAIIMPSGRSVNGKRHGPRKRARTYGVPNGATGGPAAHVASPKGREHEEDWERMWVGLVIAFYL
jgi:hypothetical protein